MRGRLFSTRRKATLAVLTACALAVSAAAALATPPLNFVGTVLARGTVQDNVPTTSGGRGRSQKAPGDVAFLNVAVQPGGHSGWHAHPGPEIAVVKSGAVTVYYADDPACTPHRFTPGQGYVVEYRGAAIEALSMEARMTICNMSIEWGAKAGLIAPDDMTFAYLYGRPSAPSGSDWDAAVEHWRGLTTDVGAEFDREIRMDASTISPFVTWGTNPGHGVPLSAYVPSPDSFPEGPARQGAERALTYMGLAAGTPMREIAVDTVFVGSCTNGRMEDLRAAAAVIEGHQVSSSVRMLVVPGSTRVRLQAEAEGLDSVFTGAGAEWRGAGCSMCLGMNPDQLAPGERSASTSNRNFEGRQGKGGRTHLVSPQVAAATAVVGRLASPADLESTRG